MIDHQKVRYGPPASVSTAAAKSKNDSFKEKEYTFSRVFQEDATQEDLYFVGRTLSSVEQETPNMVLPRGFLVHISRCL